ncbi:hypothetical protein BKM09_013695 [Pseudomonas amygdali pv. morsprunorum]|nr:MobA/MobL family protein [Pseudomonas amygdali]POY79736.1 hypothetical protein BKM09_013695 [Pseudomonas amygdali pv. morsprunorum]
MFATVEDARQELASAFGIELATRYGVAVDLAIHLPNREGDNRNHHAFVMTTTCNDLQSKWPRPAIIAFFDRD